MQKSSTKYYQTESNSTLKGSCTMIKWGLSQGCKDSSIYANQSMWYTILTNWKIFFQKQGFVCRLCTALSSRVWPWRKPLLPLGSNLQLLPLLLLGLASHFLPHSWPSQFGQCLGSPETQFFPGTSPALPGLWGWGQPRWQPCSSAAPFLFFVVVVAELQI